MQANLRLEKGRDIVMRPPVYYFRRFLYKPVVVGAKQYPNEIKGYRFHMMPRTFNIFIYILVLSPITIPLIGILGTKELFDDINRAKTWSSYEITKAGGEPTKKEMFDLF